MTAVLLKAVGAAAVFVSAVFLGRGLGGRRRAATAQLAGFLRLFRAIRSGIEYYRAPVGDILARVEPEVAAACSGRGEAVRGETLAAWLSGCVFLSDGLGRLMARAASELGRGYHDEQLAVCDRYIEALEAMYRDSMNKQREQSGLVSTLILAAAAGVVILLI